MNVLKNITENVKIKLDMVSSVACLQGMVEITYENSFYGKYLTATESDNIFQSKLLHILSEKHIIPQIR